MSNDDLEIIIAGGAGRSAANAADHIALALMGAGASVDFPGRPNREARSGQTLRGVHAVVRMEGGAGLAVLPGSSRGGGNLPAAAKIAVGVVALLVLCSAEVRLHFGLRLDTIITAAAIWWFWRWCHRKGTMTT
ncbi:MAG: hypothetical protein ACLPJJ_10890 [Acidocella sp.]|uniref:hypothetical protein n=1 Tax=Acidocella sp. TaxID=50710 RepID=UPI003FD80CEE